MDGCNVIIAGGRGFCSYDGMKGLRRRVATILTESCRWGDWTIVSGGAIGADRLGEMYAKECDYNLKIFKANWDEHGKAAGPIRNKEMAEYSDMLIAFWDGKSKGTKNMIDTALKHKLEVHVFIYQGEIA